MLVVVVLVLGCGSSSRGTSPGQQFRDTNDLFQ